MLSRRGGVCCPGGEEECTVLDERRILLPLRKGRVCRPEGEEECAFLQERSVLPWRRGGVYFP